MSDFNIALTDEALFMALWGSGASYTYDWYRETVLDEEAQTWHVRLDNGEGGSESAILTPASLRRTIESIVLDKPEYTYGVLHTDWDDDQCDSDIDADTADTIVQYAVFGRVIFG